MWMLGLDGHGFEGWLSSRLSKAVLAEAILATKCTDIVD